MHTHEITYRTATPTAAFNKKTLFTSRLDLKFKEQTTALYGAANWTFQKVHLNHLESFEIWFQRRMEISLTDQMKKEGRLIGLVTSCVGTVF
jgi:hypothetical protein